MKFKVTGSKDDIEYYDTLLCSIHSEQHNPFWKKTIEHNDLVKNFKKYHYCLDDLTDKSEYLIERLDFGKKTFWQNKDFFCFLDQEEQRIENERLNQKLIEEYEPYLQKLYIAQEQYMKKLSVSIADLSEIRSFLNKKSCCDSDKDLYKTISKELNTIEIDVIHGCYNHSVQNDLEIDCSGNIISDE